MIQALFCVFGIFFIYYMVVGFWWALATAACIVLQWFLMGLLFNWADGEK